MSENKIEILIDKIESVDPKVLKLDPKNRNKHSEAQIDRLIELIKNHGWRQPIIVSTLDGYVKAGNGRLLAALKMKLARVPVSYQSFRDDMTSYSFSVSDNAIAAWAELDLSQINSDIGDYGPELNVDMLGIRGFEVEVADKISDGDPDAVPDVPLEPKAKLGDIYQLGKHRLMCGDSTSIDAVEALMNGEKADLVLTDPPYNIASHSKNYVASSSNDLGGDISKSLKELSNSEWDKNFNIETVLPNVLMCSNIDCSYYIFSSHLLIDAIWKFFYESKMSFVGYNIWYKPNPMPCLSKRHWTWSHELCAYATRGKHKFNFPKEGHAFSVWTFTKKSDGSHPTQKPIELLNHILLHSSNEQQSVCDLFGGSGSTLIACEKTKRRCFMMELERRYIDVIIKRWEDYTGQQALLLTGPTREATHA